MCLSFEGTVVKVEGDKAVIRAGKNERRVTSPLPIKKGDKVVVAFGFVVEKIGPSKMARFD